MATQKPMSYQELRAELDEVLAELQNPDVDIDRAIALHKQATQLVDKLEAHLEKAQMTITSLTKQSD